jgi:hypothetical protein
MNRVRLFLQAVLAVRSISGSPALHAACTHNVGDLAENPVMTNWADKPCRPPRATYQPLRLGPDWRAAINEDEHYCFAVPL